MTEPKEIPETNAPTELTDEELKAVAGGDISLPPSRQAAAAAKEKRYDLNNGAIGDLREIIRK